MVRHNKIWKEATKFENKGRSNYHNKKCSGSVVDEPPSHLTVPM